MDEQTQPTTRRRRLKAAPPPQPLRRDVERAAKVIHRDKGVIDIETLRIASLQVAAKRLAEVQQMLAYYGAPTAQVQAVPQFAPPPQSTGPTCAICGRPGVYKAKKARVAPGQQPPWYCRSHASMGIGEDRAEDIVPPSAPANGGQAAGAPSLAAALKALDA